MTDWKQRLKGDPMPWLLEDDPSNPGVRYFALTDLIGLSPGNKDVVEARKAVMSFGPVAAILSAQEPDGHWGKAGPGYSPKYTATIWQVIFLAQLGADSNDTRVRKACEYLLSHALAGQGGFAFNGQPNGFLHCLSGNLCSALIDFGFLDDPRLQRALDWEARMITGDGVSDISDKGTCRRYYAYSPGPNFVCGPNNGLPCGWGAIKAMISLGKVPVEKRSTEMQRAIEHGTRFLLSYDVATASYPFGSGDKPSSSWFKFAFPLGYIADVLQALEALLLLGEAHNPGLADAIELVLSKQDNYGRWKLENTYRGKMWADIEKKGQPSKWVTLRALRVLRTVFS
jgi:hypothetical protein